MRAVNLSEKLGLITTHWAPRIIAELGENYVKLTKLEGEFIWHKHDDEDELFFVVHGRLLMRFRDREEWIEEGELLVVPRGVEHQPVAPEEVHVMLIEPKTTVNTGDAESDRTVPAEWL